MNDFPVPTTPTYTTHDRVAKLLRQAPFTAHANVDELDSDLVDDWILEAESELENELGRAWRERRVTNAYYPFSPNVDEEGFMPIHLGPIHIRAVTGLEVWMDDEFVDYIATKTEGRDQDWYLVEDEGILYISARTGFSGSRHHRVRTTYTYGLSQVPGAIRRATDLITASLIATGMKYEDHGHGSETDGIKRPDAAARWMRQANAILDRYRRLVYA